MPFVTIPLLNVTYTRRQLVAMVVLFFAYIAAVQLGRFLFTAPAVIQPAAGIAFALLVVEGIALWPAILAAATLNSLFNDAPLGIALIGATANTLHAVIAAYALKFLGFDPVFRRVKDTFVFLAVALIASAIIPSLILPGIELYNLLAAADWPVRTTWVAYWAGIMIGDVVLAAAIIRFLAKPVFTRTRMEVVELSLASVSLATLSYLTFWTNASQATNGLVLLLYLLPFIWFSLRLGNRFTFIAFAMTTIIGLTGVLYGDTPSENPLARRVITLELFFATLAVIFYLFTAVVEERKRATRQLHAQLSRVNSLLDDAKREDRAKSEFIAVFAHELRNPLAPIVSATELLKLRFGAHPEIAPIVDTLTDRTSTVVHLLDDLLDLARISQGKLRLRKEPAALCDITRRSALAIESHFKSKGQTLSIETPNMPIRMDVDPVRIEQIVNNLLSNASKFSPHGAEIKLRVRRAGRNAEITVRDTGIGIKPHMLSRIFEPFLQVETQIRNSGLGIGLSLTKKLVEEHGGTIVAKSDGEGRGSEFVVSLPLPEETPVTSFASNFIRPMEPVISKTSMKVLVVDDNEAAAKGLGTLLQHVGNTVELAFSGSDAVGKAAAFGPDVVVLDIGLPDISGYEVAEQLRAAGFSGRIIALTGYGQDEDKKKAEAAGFDYHLTKPVGIADLQAVLVAA